MLTQGYACAQIEWKHLCLNRFACDFRIALFVCITQMGGLKNKKYTLFFMFYFINYVYRFATSCLFPRNHWQYSIVDLHRVQLCAFPRCHCLRSSVCLALTEQPNGVYTQFGGSKGVRDVTFKKTVTEVFSSVKNYLYRFQFGISTMQCHPQSLLFSPLSSSCNFYTFLGS